MLQLIAWMLALYIVVRFVEVAANAKKRDGHVMSYVQLVAVAGILGVGYLSYAVYQQGESTKPQVEETPHRSRSLTS